jgi:hypothetical protein
MLETREALRQWGFVPAPRENVHTFVRLRCTYAADVDLQAIGRNLDWMLQLRNRADYDLTATVFDTDVQAEKAINTAVQDFPRLDAIMADPGRAAAVTADIRARWP